MIDCRRTNHVIFDKSIFQVSSMLEGEKVRCLLLKAMGRNSEYMVLEKFASPPTVALKLKYTFNFQRALHVPSFKFHLILV